MAGGRILQGELRVINLGLELFAENLRSDGVEVVQVDWRPPAGGDARLAALLARLDDDCEAPAPSTEPSEEP
jgi:FdrA protein